MIIQGTKVQKFIGYFNRDPRNFYQYLLAAKKGSHHGRSLRRTGEIPFTTSTHNAVPVLNGEHYLTGEEVCRRLCISKRTLQDYRDTGLLGYVQLPGKIIYRESEILDLLERHYRK